MINGEIKYFLKKCAFDSILESMGMPIPISQQITTSYDLNHDFVKKFITKYELS